MHDPALEARDVADFVRALAPRSRAGTWLWRALPGHCLLCHQSSRLPLDLCEVCLHDLPWNHHACVRCGLPLALVGIETCAACLARPPPFVKTVTPLRYTDAVVHMVHALKFQRSLVHGRVLATLLTAAVRRAYVDPTAAIGAPDLIVPVPLSLWRLVQRGHNQAAVLARRVGSEIGVRVDYQRCRRIRHTAPQMGRTRRQRLRNLAGAFEFRGALDNLAVAVIDDVMTTGATARAVCRALLACGAREVHIWAAARTDRPR